MIKKMYGLILLFSTVAISSQTVKTNFTVLSVEDMQPLSNAEICIVGSDTVCLFSDEKGNASIDLLKSKRLKISVTKQDYEIYEEEIEIDGRSIVFYLWKNNVISLNEIIVSARKKNLVRKSGTTTLTVDSSAIFQNAVFKDIIGIIPGVTVSNDKIDILGKNRILYLLNGRETSVNISQISSDKISQIDVMSNPSAKYQANYDAVVNIILKKNENIGYSASIGTAAVINRRYSQYNDADITANFGKLSVEADINYNFDYAYVHDNGWQEYENMFETFQQYYDHKLQEFGIASTVNYEIDKKNDIGASISYTNQPKNSSTIKTESSFFDLNNSLDSLIVSYNNQNTIYNSLNTNVFHSYKNKNKSLTSYFSFINVKNELHNRLDSYNELVNSLKQNVFSGENSKTYIVNSDYEHRLNNVHNFGAGIRLTRFDGNYSLLNHNFNEIIADVLFNFNENIAALYALYSFQKSNFNFSLGLRYEYFIRNVNFNNLANNSIKEGNFFPSISLNYKTADNLHTFDWSYTKKIQRPTFSNITPFEYNYNYNTVFRGNPDLKNEIIHSLQATYNFNDALSIMPYFNYYNNHIQEVYYFENEKIIWFPSNYQTNEYGTYIHNNFTLFKKLTFINQLQLGNETSKGIVENIEFDKSNFKFSLYFVQSLKINNKFSITAYSSYNSKQIFNFTEQRQGFRADLSFTARLFQNKLSCRIRFNDVFNTFHNTLYRNSNGIKSYRYSDWGVRGLMLSIRYNFQSGKPTKENAVNIDNSSEMERIIN
ncbi:TonB-dependent receptor [Bacteroidia bacterium]|nr:TonB-dependent receptor [Bacteroidia bacterium]